MINKVALFKDRLTQALDIRDSSAAELSRKTKISEATISQYRSGYAKPKEDKLAIISNALNVNPSWLMGLDVPMEIEGSHRMALTTQEHDLILQYRAAPDVDKRMVERILNYASALKGDENNES